MLIEAREPTMLRVSSHARRSRYRGTSKVSSDEYAR